MLFFSVGFVVAFRFTYPPSNQPSQPIPDRVGTSLRPCLFSSAGNRSRSTYFEHDIISTEVIQRQHAVRINPMIGNLHYGRPRFGTDTPRTVRNRDSFNDGKGGTFLTTREGLRH